MRTTPGTRFLTLISAGLMGAILGCGSESAQPVDDFIVEYLGDTMIIRDQIPKEWVVPRSLELDLLVGEGSAEGELAFGRLNHMAVSPTGAIVVEDVMGNTVLRLRPDGTVQDTIGGRGEGPGEYRYPYGLGVFPDGGILVRDEAKRALLRYDSTGAFLKKWDSTRDMRNNLGVEVGWDGVVVVRGEVEYRGVFLLPNERLTLLSPIGEIVDSLPPVPTPWDSDPVWGAYFPKKIWAWHDSAYYVVGVGSGYHFDIHRGGRVIRVEQPHEPVPVSQQERDAFEVEMEWRKARGGAYLDRIQPPPEVKGAYHEILIARTGEIWVFRHGDGLQWSTVEIGHGLQLPLFREPLLADVFYEDGRYLGSVNGDGAIRPRVISHDTVWAILTGPAEEDLVARYLVR